jgi:hypothetical protein
MTYLLVLDPDPGAGIKQGHLSINLSVYLYVMTYLTRRVAYDNGELPLRHMWPGS